MDQQGEDSHTGNTRANWALLGLLEPEASGRLAHALYHHGLPCVSVFDAHGMLAHLDRLPDLAVVIMHHRLPPTPTSPDTMPDLIATVRSRIEAAILTLSAQPCCGLNGADTNLHPTTSTETIAAVASALANSERRHSSSVARWGPLQLDTTTQSVRWNSQNLRLTEHEFRVLETLVHARGRTVSHRQLAAAAYGRTPQPGDDGRIRTTVSRLRKHLNKASPAAAEIIGTGYRLGYRLLRQHGEIG